MPVYLLHSTTPLYRANGQTVEHYLGYCDPGNLSHRFGEHVRGRNTSVIVKAFLARGGTFLLGNYWPERTRADERRMKESGHLRRQCLVCQMRELGRELDGLHSLVTPGTPTSPPVSPERETASRRPSTKPPRTARAGTSSPTAPRRSTGSTPTSTSPGRVPAGGNGGGATVRRVRKATRVAGIKR